MSSDWQAEGFRLTVFPTQQTGENEWWKHLTGETPEQEIKSPRTGTTQQSGPFEDGLLELSIQPVRIDWKAKLLPDGEQQENHP